MSPRLLGYTRIFYWYDNGQYKPRVIEENKHTRVEYTSVRIHDGYILSSHEPSYFFPGRWFDCCDIFFVLSGFAMTIGYKDRVFNSDFSYSNYLLRRLSKFYPLHWLILFYILATHFTTLYQQDYFFAKLATNFLLIQSFVPSKDFYFAYNSPSWYLCNTLFYCVIFPFLLRFIVDCKRNVRRAFLVGLLSVYVLLIIFLPKEWHHAILYVNPFVRILDFVLGIYTVLLFFDLREDSKLVRQKSLLNTVVFVCFVVLALVSFSLTGTEVYELFKRFYWLLFCPMILAVSLKSVRGGTYKRLITRHLE